MTRAKGTKVFDVCRCTLKRMQDTARWKDRASLNFPKVLFTHVVAVKNKLLK